MGVLVHPSTGVTRQLPTLATIGRNPVAWLRLDDASVSADHAVVRWLGGWWLQSRGRNGTTVSGVPAPPSGARLRAGDEIVFGAPSAGVWVLADDGPPLAFARHLALGTEIVVQGDLLALPTGRGSPPVSVFRDPERGYFRDDVDGAPAPVRDGDFVEAAGTWQLFLPTGVVSTRDTGPRLSVDRASLRIDVAGNGDYVSIELRDESTAARFPAMAPWDVLLVLAEERLRDADVAEAEQGWRDTDWLRRALGYGSVAHLDVNISRAREALAQGSVDQAHRLVEVRRRQRRLGLPPARVAIVRS